MCYKALVKTVKEGKRINGKIREKSVVILPHST